MIDGESGHLVRIATVECLDPSNEEFARAHQATILSFTRAANLLRFGPMAFSTPGFETRFCRISFAIDLGAADDALIE
jgi:hypothetical protein